MSKTVVLRILFRPSIISLLNSYRQSFKEDTDVKEQFLIAI